MKNLILCFVLALSFGGCVTAGSKNMNPDKLSSIQPGRTTLANLTAWFGSPFSLTSDASGNSAAIWYHMNVVTEADNRTLAVLLDSKNLVVKSVVTNTPLNALGVFREDALALQIKNRQIQAEQERQSREIYLAATPNLPKEIHDAILEDKVAIGMTQTQTLLVWPSAQLTHSSQSAAGTTEEWVHSDTHLFFVDGILSQISR